MKPELQNSEQINENLISQRERSKSNKINRNKFDNEIEFFKFDEEYDDQIDLPLSKKED